MRTVYKYIKPVLWPMIGGLTLKFIAAMFDLTIPYFLETIIDKAGPVLVRGYARVLRFGSRYECYSKSHGGQEYEQGHKNAEA